MGYLTKEIIAAYKDKLERGIAEYMGMPAGERSAAGVRGMLELSLIHISGLMPRP